MELLTKELREILPGLFSEEDVTELKFYAKFFTPDSIWTWYAEEGSPDGDDFRFYGYVKGLEEEWGYFLLSELTQARGPMGLPIERDLYFEPVTASAVVRRR